MVAVKCRCQLQDANQDICTDAAGHAKQLRQMHSKCKKLKVSCYLSPQEVSVEQRCRHKTVLFVPVTSTFGGLSL